MLSPIIATKGQNYASHIGRDWGSMSKDVIPMMDFSPREAVQRHFLMANPGQPTQV